MAITYNSNRPEQNDTEPILLAKILNRLEDNAGASADTPSGNVAITNLPLPVTDNSGSLTVDGTVNVGNFPASQAVNDGGGSLTVDDGGASLTVDGTVAVSNFPAVQPVDDNGGSLTVDNAGTFAVQVTSGGTTQYAEDTAATAGEQVTMAGAVRRDARSSLVDADGDRTELQCNSSGDLRVDGSAVTQPISAVALPLPSGAATEGAQAALFTLIDGQVPNADTPQVAGQSLFMAGAVRKDTQVSLVSTDGDRTELQTNALGALRVETDKVALDTTYSVTEGLNMVGVVRLDNPGSLVGTNLDRSTLQVDSNGSLRVAVMSGGTTQYAEDTVSTAADLLTMAGAVRKDTAATLVDTDGDRTQLQVDASGRLHVNVGAGGTTQYAEDTASTAADLVTMAGVVRKDTAVSLVDADNDRTQLQVNSTGSLRVDPDATAELAKFGTSTAMTITLASLATSTAGVGRQTTMISNTTDRFKRIQVYFRVTTGTTPTANKSIRFFLLKGDDPSSSNIRTDNAGASDAGLTVVTADQIYAVATSSTSDQAYRGSFTIENPGPEWGLCVVHDTGVNLNATGGNHSIRYVGENTEAQ